MTTYILSTILWCGLVTWLSRVIPFVLIKNLTVPKWLIEFLSFVPVAIMTAIFVESLLVYHAGHWPTVNLANLYASIPAIGAGILTKSLLAVVITGVVAMALIRLLGWA
ncbi:AzlD domain-containing protein [Lactiplantibacillus mudanjiangensis]|uniref:Integral membrane protein [Lactobacillus plantarum JDM1] n=1 Tax=Lactiplantibacillus mudanjiangensis TaxID=1296538 RepID=A0A660E5P4_9LACO|nr:AzlD domain-containing protein [Lactiplantibacillus mudanjiangensis]VDG17730.1 integral membrane protein [Lactobacillus plantarum JDM1] [Lactiplantibacillus mudanjiangensis]VDG25126.1 integral membrane protein [Lactobacillus plantarum JDM1] [Lactiplantibacillus mudanjiangensis]VDG29465.1 integral membrane protein [Lactobacillus plantarum JDM1] [Lactiplantibacillus mudanjiangensis]VDG32578.1 integral membrane protein [Lactobacillus plantarum JDM1] [Lactiplantibacillus mudanjiangensis]